MKEIIKFDHVHVFEGSNMILQDVNFSVNRGDLIFIVGKTGTGKSSLINAIYAASELEGGRAFVLGYDLIGIKPKEIRELRTKIALLYDHDPWVHYANHIVGEKVPPGAHWLRWRRTVERNFHSVLSEVKYGGKKLRENKMDELLGMVGILHRKGKLTRELNRFDRILLTIAKVFIKPPEIILADQLTGNLDPENSAIVMDLLLNLQKKFGFAIIMASHDFMLMQWYYKRMWITERGKMAELSITEARNYLYSNLL